MDTLIVVGAGDGGRMGGVNKCLLEVNRKPLLEKYLELFKGFRVIFVAGYNAEKIHELYGGQMQVVENPQWAETNSAYSLFMGLQYFYPDGDTVVIDSDLYFDFVPMSRGYYCTPLKESVVYRGKKTTINDCAGWFRGIARLSAADVSEYMRQYDSSHQNKYWCNVMDNVEIVLTDEPIQEFDTWEDYNGFQHKRD